MSLPIDARTMMAAGHVNMATYQGKTIDIYKFDGNSPAGALIAGGGGLKALVRQPRRTELALFSTIGIVADLMFEVARQGTADLTQLLPHKFAVKYGGVFYEITSIEFDDAETSTLGKEDASVYTLASKKLAADVGRRVS